MASSAKGKSLISVVRLRGVPILDQLIMEEVLLRKCKRNYFLLNSEMRAQDTSIVLGLSGKIAELVNVDLLKKQPVHLIRRYTGGGTVLVDPLTLFASFIMNASDVPSLPYPRDIMTWSESIYGPVFNSFCSKSKSTSPSNNLFTMKENDYCLGERKIGGNAQTITKNRWVHHTSFLWDFDAKLMEYLQLPKKRPEYRLDRPHGSFLSPIKDHVPSLSAWEEAICSRLSDLYDVEHESAAAIQVKLTTLLDGAPADTVARTRLESLEEHLRKTSPNPEGLVKRGPSCTTLT